MTVKYGWQFTNLFLYEGLYEVNLGGSSTNRYLYVTVFPGVQPSAASILSSWSTYSALYLAHFIYNSAGGAWTVYNSTTEGTAYISTTQSPTTTAYRTGTATWGIIWTTGTNGPSEATVQGASLPSTRFIVAPVGDFTSNDVIRLQSTSIVATTTATLNGVVIDVALNPGD